MSKPEDLQPLVDVLRSGSYDARPEGAGEPTEVVSIIPIVERAMRASIIQLTGIDIGPGEDDDAE